MADTYIYMLSCLYYISPKIYGLLQLHEDKDYRFLILSFCLRHQLLGLASGSWLVLQDVWPTHLTWLFVLLSPLRVRLVFVLLMLYPT